MATAFKLSEKLTSSKKPVATKIENKKIPIPEPEAFTIDYAKNNYNFVSYIIKEPKIKIGTITGAKKYPCIKDSSGVIASGKPVAVKFLRGLTTLGLGNVTPNEKHFKRSSLKDCPNEDERENLRKNSKCSMQKT